MPSRYVSIPSTPAMSVSSDLNVSPDFVPPRDRLPDFPDLAPNMRFTSFPPASVYLFPPRNSASAARTRRRRSTSKS